MSQNHIVRCQELADKGVAHMRNIVGTLVAPNHIVGLNGSYARREVTSGSDVDLFIFVNRENECADGKAALIALKERLTKEGYKLAAEGGVFDQPIAIDTLFTNIGGMNDSNVFITRRMLLLLEGEWLHGKASFDETRSRLIERYVTDKIRDEQIALFLLNDIIRYWRTICVDYEHKIGQGKAAEIRLLKLRFSRMLLYMGGLVAVGSTHKLAASAKRERLIHLLAMPLTQRISHVLGENAKPALSIYSEFLAAIDDERIRNILSTERSLGDAYSAEYQNLRERAQDFRNQLRAALEIAFPEPHPLLHSILL